MDAFRALVVDKHGDQLMADIREVERCIYQRAM